jgi:hypothetical protein
MPAARPWRLRVGCEDNNVANNTGLLDGLDVLLRGFPIEFVRTFNASPIRNSHLYPV